MKLGKHSIKNDTERVKVNGKNKIVLSVGGAIIGLSLISGIYLVSPQTDTYILAPSKSVLLAGNVTDTSKLRATSVSMTQATGWDVLQARIDPKTSVAKYKSSTVDGLVSTLDYSNDTAWFNAKRATYDLLGLEPDITYNGWIVTSVNNDSPFYESLKPDDVILSINNRATQVESLDVSDITGLVTMVVQRGDELLTINKSIDKSWGFDYINSMSINDGIDVDTGLNGESTGLVYALYTYTQLTQNGIKSNMNVSATGAIDSNGKLYGVEGIVQKVYESRNDDLMIVAKDNLETAKSVVKKNGYKVKVVGFDTFADVIDYLNDNNYLSVDDNESSVK